MGILGTDGRTGFGLLIFIASEWYRSRLQWKVGDSMKAFPTELSLRAYRVGFGDCFLLTFHYPSIDRHVLIDFGSTAAFPGQSSDAMLKIAKDIRATCGGKLHAVIVTHRHRDHLSGFAMTKDGKGPGAEIAACVPDLVLQPWTEDPKAAPDALGPTSPRSRAKGFVASLNRMHEVSANVQREAKELATRRAEGVNIGKNLVDELEFLGGENLANRSAVENLMRMGTRKNARAVYASFGARSGLERLLPGVQCQVLGPPTLKQSESIRKERARDPDEFWQLMALTAGEGRGTSLPFSTAKKNLGRIPPSARWLRNRMLQLRGQQLLQLVRSLDEAMNNTSLILLFQVGRYRLLFPGDAQIENWSYALNRAEKSKTLRQQLSLVNMYKVGHHGSLNATPKSLWALFDNLKSKHPKSRLWSLISTRKGKHGKATKNTEVPRTTLVHELEDETKYVTTEKGSGIGPRVIRINFSKGTAQLEK
jgi:ribonuclease BN (tRNA processing enzyme)